MRKRDVLRIVRWVYSGYRFILSCVTFIFDLMPKRTLRLPVNGILLKSSGALAEDIRHKKIKSEEVVQAYIQRIQEVQPKINAIVDQRFESALEDAREVDRYIATCGKTSHELATEKPLLGVPFSVKSNLSVKGLAWDVGIVARKGVKGERDSDVVELMKQAGAIPLAVTNTPELCLSWHTRNHIHGSTLNPFDLSKSPGGSSGGESALISSAGSVIGIGNDLCGSLRIPACFTSIFAHKPTSGLISSEGVYPKGEKGLLQLFTNGPMCRYAMDLAPMLKIMAGENSNKLQLDKKIDFHDLKIFLIEDDLGDPFVASVQPEIRKAIRKAVQYFDKKYGINAQVISIPKLRFIYLITSFKMTSSTNKRVCDFLSDGKPHFNLGFEFLKAMFNMSDHTIDALWFCLLDKIAPNSPKILKIAEYLEQSLAKDVDAVLKENCVLFLPTVSDASIYPFEAISKMPSMTYVSIFNVLGQPVTQCPLGLNKDNFPIGMQVIAGHYQDHLTIAVARELEKVFGGWRTPW